MPQVTKEAWLTSHIRSRTEMAHLETHLFLQGTQGQFLASTGRLAIICSPIADSITLSRPPQVLDRQGAQTYATKTPIRIKQK